MANENDSIEIESEKEKELYTGLVEKGVNNKLQHQQSLQHNRQDMDQTQEVDVKPSQMNFQKIDLTINNKIENYSGRISGCVQRQANGEIVSGADIYLYFGSGAEFPVCRIQSDVNGNYCLGDLPPGYYTITAKSGEMQCLVRNIKVLPGAASDQTLLLVQRIGYSLHAYGTR